LVRIPRKAIQSLWHKYTQSKVGLTGLIILILFGLAAVLAPVFMAYPSQFGTTSQYLNPPSAAHPLGTNEVGQDILALVLFGARTSITVGLVATAISIIIGTLVGLLAGFYGGHVDTALMRGTDIFLVLPTLVLMIIVASVVGPNLVNVIVIIGILGWPSAARIVRSQVLSVKEKPFVDASRVAGSSNLNIIRRHILPSVAPLVFANAALVVSNAVISESVLSFFGLGDPLSISWGTVLRDSFLSGSMIAGAYWYALPPGICLTLVALAFTMVGFSLDNILNPKIKSG
jgi:peptide/nickel transport system permease protein